MKIDKKYIFRRFFKRFFKEEFLEIENKKRAIKIANENLQSVKIELKNSIERVNKLIEENTILRRENGQLRNEVDKTKKDIINSNEYRTLLEKYNELLYKK